MKRPSNIILICSLGLGAIAVRLAFTAPPISGSSGGIKEQIMAAIVFGIGGCMVGAVIGVFIYLFIKPTRTQVLLRKNNEILSKVGKENKIDDLNNLNNLRKSGVITEEEFIKLKKEVINK